MGLSSRQFLISSDGTLYRLFEIDFGRLYRGQGVWRIPALASQRIRWASLAVELFDRQPLRAVRMSLGFLQFDDTGRLDVDRLNREQGARMDATVAPFLDNSGADTVIDASSRFAARGGLWRPDAKLTVTLHAAALGRLACPRIKLES